MVVTTITLGLIALISVFLIVAFALDNKHAFFKILSLFFAFSTMLVLSSDMIANKDYCEILVNNTITTGNQTDYTYSRVCFDSGKSTADISFKLVNYYIRIAQIYMFIFIIYYIFMGMGIDLLTMVKRLFKIR